MTVDIKKNPATILQHIIPEAISFMDESLVVTTTLTGIKDLFTSYDEASRTISVDTSMIREEFVGMDYVIDITLDDG